MKTTRHLLKCTIKPNQNIKQPPLSTINVSNCAISSSSKPRMAKVFPEKMPSQTTSSSPTSENYFTTKVVYD